MSEDSGENIPDTDEEQVKTSAINTIEDEVDIDVLQNIPVTLSAEVGRTVMKIKDILQLSEGSIVELDRIAGESIDVLVNNTAVARAEVVVINERYGIRLTQVLDAADRLRKL
jgi:flagellar motor switch protein FliN/FliY